MAFVATLQRDARSTARHAVGIDGTLRDADWRPFDVTIEDLSTDGFRVPTDAALPIGSWISLGLPGIGARSAVVVRTIPGAYGCQFAVALTDAELVSTLHALPDDPLSFPGTPFQDHDLSVDMPQNQADGLSGSARLMILLGSTMFCWSVVVVAWVLLR